MCASKIVISGIRHFECALDLNGDFIAGKSTIILKSKENADLKIALPILNSSLITFFIKEAFGVLGIGGGINFTADLVENLPLCRVDDRERKKLKKLSDDIIKIVEEKDWPNNTEGLAKVHKHEKQIDHLVYKLYGLTPEEIMIVENPQL